MKYLKKYINTFSGLRKQVWFLAFVTFVNRAGTMVIPFLVLYLSEDLDFTKPQVGWILTSFGLGSLIGSWLGGKLTDKIGYYPIMFVSLFTTGVGFIFLQYFRSFESFFIGIFLIMVVADTFRPANFTAITVYSKPENRTRSITLIRLAINLGFSFGPAAGGFIIVTLGYGGLFWIDGITCILGALLILILLKPKEIKQKAADKLALAAERVKSLPAHRDHVYMLFLLVLFLIGVVFMQLFSSLPLYYREEHLLSESTIGWLMALNGLLIFFFEMPLVSFFEGRKTRKLTILQYSIVLLGLSYLVLIFDAWLAVIVIGVLLITIGEMLAFPFANAYAMNWAPNGRSGEYLGMFTMTFSLAHIVGPNMGVQVADRFGYDACWILMAAISIIALVLLVYLKKLMVTKPRQALA
ncbi:MAG: MFS transporter [Chitinophagales bacterium]